MTTRNRTKTESGIAAVAMVILSLAAVLTVGSPSRLCADIIDVPNGDFETLYKPDTTIEGNITPLPTGGWSQGVGPDCPIAPDSPGAYEFDDGTFGDVADIPGWIGADRDGWIANGGTYNRDQTTGNLQGSIASQFNFTEGGSMCYLANGGSWGNPAGGLIVSTAPLATIEGDRSYTVSMMAFGVATPLSLDLLADGVAIVPSFTVDPVLSGDWQEYSRTYDPANLADYVGQELTIQLGVNRGAEGTQTRFDDVSLFDSAPPPLLTLEVNTVTGEISLLGDEIGDVDINFYEITSAGNSLDATNWLSLADQDFDGNGPPSGTGDGWEEWGGVGSHALAEGYLLGNSTIDANASVSLGMGYDVGVNSQDLEFRYRAASERIFEGLIEYITPRFEADFDEDGDVDGDDFLLWQTGFGTPSGAEKMDGDYDNDGDVDGDDFLGWQAEFGSPGGAAAQGVPEPACFGLLAAGGAGLVVWRRRRSNRS